MAGAARRRWCTSQEQIVLAITVAVFAVFSVVVPGFLAPGNVTSLVQNVSVLGILGVGMALTILGHGIDLSMVASMSVSVAWMLVQLNAGVPMVVALPLAIGFSIAVGIINGILVAYVEVPAIFATLAMVIITNSLIRLGLRSGASSLVLGTILIAAVAVDVRWLKNRSKLLARAYVSPTFFALPPLQEVSRDPDSPYALNDLLSVAEPIGVGEVDGPEDVILDEDGNLYCGSRDGDIIRFLAPDHKQREVYVHIGGQTLGLAFDRDGNLLTCVGGMGLYKVTRDSEVIKLSDETNRSWFSIVDDSRMRLADDLDIAPDGRVFFSEATIRYEIHDWIIDALEGRGNGRIICYDPRDGTSRTVISKLQFPNWICMVPDGESFLFAETWGCRISRYWYAGARKGHREAVISDLPGYPDNLNLASDGNFWCGIIGMRAPAFDLAQKMPSFRRRMVMRIARDEWLYPNMNTGGVVKFNLDGKIVASLWDGIGERHPQVTSMREHKGYLYLGGIFNNRIGKYMIPGADPEWTAGQAYWGKASRKAGA